MIRRLSTIALLFLVLFYGCFPPTATSTLVGGKYEPKTNTTDYFVFPYGSVSLPGEWTKGIYGKSSRQQWFSNKDSVFLAIAFGPCNKYEFYKPELKDFNFVKAYYNWESDFYKNQLKTESKIILADSTNNFIIWQLFDNKNVDMYFLFGYNKCSIHNYCLTTEKWKEQEKIKFLQDLYLNKK